MALPPAPSNFQSLSSCSVSQSLYFIKFHPQIHSLKSSRGRNLKISCCQRTIQIGDETQPKADVVVKKKRKPRPSFLQKIQEKWSLKSPSLRENFPWEVQENSGTNREAQTQQVRSSVDVSFEKESIQSSPVREPMSGRTDIKSTLDSRVHENGPRPKQFSDEGFKELEVKISRTGEVVDGFHEHRSYPEALVSNGQGFDDKEKVGLKRSFHPEGFKRLEDEVRMNGKGVNAFHELQRNEEALDSNCQRSDDIEKDAILDGKTADEGEEFEESLIGLQDINNDILRDDESTGAMFVEDSSPSYQDVSSKANAWTRLPWESKKSITDEKFVKEKPVNSNSVMADRLIPELEIKRLRNVSLRMMERIKVGAAGVTQALVDAIHDKWKDEEVVKLKFVGPPSMNMRRTHEILESRTGGLVIWRSGSSVVLYRGMTYKYNCVKSYTRHVQSDAAELGYSAEGSHKIEDDRQNYATESSRLYNPRSRNSFSGEEQMDLSELNLLLDKLGPRFTDWSGRDPLPVDADLLPDHVPGYTTPFRLLPYGTRQALWNSEMTDLRRAARLLPSHFALGRSRGLQGLAMAMVKFWEMSAIAKIAIKRGVQNTSNERMAEELKRLTRGTLLSRNKEFIVFYRGNDFLPPHVSSALVDAEKRAALRQDEEVQARDRAAMLINRKTKTSSQHLVAGTLAETLAATSRWGSQPNGAEFEKMMRDAAISRQTYLVTSLQRKLTFAKWKLKKADRALQKVLENLDPESLPTDLETLTDEERFLFRRIGLSMKPFLLLGRREIFDGTIENMHLHWKYRELVKIIVKRMNISQARHIAVSLEAESGGVLVSVDKSGEGYVIIVYRGKNYKSPIPFRPRNLLTKRQALARSIELQRREALKHHVFELEKKVKKLKHELEDMESADSRRSKTLKASINAATDNDEEEDMAA